MSIVGLSGKSFGGKLMAYVFGFNEVDRTHARGDNVMNKKTAIKA